MALSSMYPLPESKVSLYIIRQLDEPVVVVGIG